ncbi:hypothetical protein HDU96_003429, partial [Phlyctochytrium bullatum]
RAPIDALIKRAPLELSSIRGYIDSCSSSFMGSSSTESSTSDDSFDEYAYKRRSSRRHRSRKGK